MKTFIIGKTYGTPSICNSECIFSYTIIARTATTVTIKNKFGDVKKCRISKKFSEHCKAETILPEGNYSMCPMLSADELIEEPNTNITMNIGGAV